MCPQKWKASAFWALIAPSTYPPPATPSSRRPVRARKPRREVAPATASLSTQRRRPEQRFQLVERVEGAFAEHFAIRREHDRVRAAGDRERLPGLGVLVLVEEPELDLGVAGEQPQRRLEGGAERAAGRGEDRDRQRGARREALDQSDAPTELRTFVVERERGLRRNREPQLADLTGQGEQRDGQRCHADERTRQTSAEPRIGRGR